MSENIAPCIVNLLKDAAVVILNGNGPVGRCHGSYQDVSRAAGVDVNIAIGTAPNVVCANLSVTGDDHVALSRRGRRGNSWSGKRRSLNLPGRELRLIVVVKGCNEIEVGTRDNLLVLHSVGGVYVDVTDIVATQATAGRSAFVAGITANDRRQSIARHDLNRIGNRAYGPGLGNQSDSTLRGGSATTSEVDGATALLNDTTVRATRLHFQTRIQTERIGAGVVSHVGTDGDISTGYSWTAGRLNTKTVFNSRKGLGIAGGVCVELPIQSKWSVHHDQGRRPYIAGRSREVGNGVENCPVHPHSPSCGILTPQHAHITGTAGTLVNREVKVADSGLVHNEALSIAGIGADTEVLDGEKDRIRHGTDIAVVGDGIGVVGGDRKSTVIGDSATGDDANKLLISRRVPTAGVVHVAGDVDVSVSTLDQREICTLKTTGIHTVGHGKITCSVAVVGYRHRVSGTVLCKSKGIVLLIHIHDNMIDGLTGGSENTSVVRACGQGIANVHFQCSACTGAVSRRVSTDIVPGQKSHVLPTQIEIRVGDRSRSEHQVRDGVRRSRIPLVGNGTGKSDESEVVHVAGTTITYISKIQIDAVHIGLEGDIRISRAEVGNEKAVATGIIVHGRTAAIPLTIHGLSRHGSDSQVVGAVQLSVREGYRARLSGDV